MNGITVEYYIKIDTMPPHSPNMAIQKTSTVNKIHSSLSLPLCMSLLITFEHIPHDYSQPSQRCTSRRSLGRIKKKRKNIQVMHHMHVLPQSIFPHIRQKQLHSFSTPPQHMSERRYTECFQPFQKLEHVESARLFLIQISLRQCMGAALDRHVPVADPSPTAREARDTRDDGCCGTLPQQHS